MKCRSDCGIKSVTRFTYKEVASQRICIKKNFAFKLSVFRGMSSVKLTAKDLYIKLLVPFKLSHDFLSHIADKKMVVVKSLESVEGNLRIHVRPPVEKRFGWSLTES